MNRRESNVEGVECLKLRIGNNKVQHVTMAVGRSLNCGSEPDQ